MSYRQAEENEEAEQRFACVGEQFANGDYDEEYSDWLMHENIYPPIDSRYELYKCMEAKYKSEDFIYEVAFGKQKLNN